MRRITLAAVLAAFTAGTAAAQTPNVELSASQAAVACAPLPNLAEPPAPDKLRVVGSQDVVQRSLFGKPELIVVNGGTQRGVQLGQDFFVRRLNRFGATYNDKLPHSVHTAGWGRIIAVNETTAIMSVDRLCTEILAGDYLDPFKAPDVAGDITAIDTTKEPDFKVLSRVLFGADERRIGSVGEFMVIDRGSKEGVMPGALFAIYRDVQTAGVPLTSIGEAAAVAVGPTMTVLRINRARDVIFSGDYAVIRK